MRLMHFSNAAEIGAASRSYQREGVKPQGFWVSDESEGSHGWSSWCRAEEYSLGTNAYDVELTDDANVLTISTADAVRDFHESYGVGRGAYYVDWARVADQWQGILITPYQWSLRLSDAQWYYSWDCASGCIWDAAAVKSVTRLGETREMVPALLEGGA